MNARPLVVLFASILSFHQPTHAQGNLPSDLTALEPLINKPQTKILKVEDGPKSHNERWIEATLVVLGNVSPSAEKKTYSTQSLKSADFDVRLRTHVQKADFATRWGELRQELEMIKPATEPLAAGKTWNIPQLNVWDLAQWEPKGLTTVPEDTMETSSHYGEVHYLWLVRTFEMEGIHVGKKTMFKANVCSMTGGTTSRFLEFGNTFDNTTGQIFNRMGRPVEWQQPLLKGNSNEMFKANGLSYLSGDISNIFNPASSRERLLFPE